MNNPNTPQQNENKPALPENQEGQRFLPLIAQNLPEKKPLQPLMRQEEKVRIAKHTRHIFQLSSTAGAFLGYLGAATATPPLMIAGLAIICVSFGISSFAKTVQRQETSALLLEEDVTSSIQLLQQTPEQTKWAVQNLPALHDFTQRNYETNAGHILTEYHRPTRHLPPLRADQRDMYTFRKQADIANLQLLITDKNEYNRLYYTQHTVDAYTAFFVQHFHGIFTQMPKDEHLWSTARSREAFSFTFAYLRVLLYMGTPAYLFTPDLINATWERASSPYRGKNGFMPMRDDAMRGKAEVYHHTLIQAAVKNMQKHATFDVFFSNYVNFLFSQVAYTSMKRNDELRHLSAAALFSAFVLNREIDVFLFKDAERAIEYGELPALQFYLQRNPKHTYNVLQTFAPYATHFLTSAKQGLAVLRETHLNTSYFTQLSFFQDPSIFHIPVAVSVSDLPTDTLQQLLNVLQTFRAKLLPHAQKELRTAEQRLSFSVWLAGYACFFADVLTPTVDLGPQFLQHYLQDLQKELYIPPEQIPQFLEMFQKAYFCFAEPAETIFASDDVQTVLDSYTGLFMASSGVTSTIFEEHLRKQTAALLPACEMALLPNDL